MCIPAALINIDRLLTLVCNQEVSPGNIYKRFDKLYIILITVISGLYLIIHVCMSRQWMLTYWVKLNYCFKMLNQPFPIT